MKKFCLIYIPALCCFQVLVAKLTQIKSGKDGYYERRKGFKIESKGPRYELSDFVVKIGSVSMSSNFKGILVEVRLRIYTKLITLIHYHINFYCFRIVSHIVLFLPKLQLHVPLFKEYNSIFMFCHTLIFTFTLNFL